MNLYDELPEPPESEEPRSRWKGCLFTLIAILVVLALLAGSIVSLFSFLTDRSTEGSSPREVVTGSSELGQTATELPPAVPSEEPLLEDEAEPTEEAGPAKTGSEVVPGAGTLAATVDRIVLINEERQVETVAPDGSERHLLTDEEQIFEFPAWAPDGSGIAALSINRSGGGIFLLEDKEAGGTQEELYFSQERRPFYLYWSPDSSQISFLANNPLEGIGLNVVSAEVGEDSKEIATGSPFYWSWTADGEQMLVHTGSEEDDSRLVLINDEGEDEEPQIPGPGFFQAPGISPSGRYWAYSQFRDGGLTWVTVEDRSTGDQISERHAGAAALSWSPVADQLAFVSGEDDGQFSFWGPLRLLDAATGELRLLSSDLVLAFFWSPNGEQIFTVSLPNNNDFNGSVEVRETKQRRLARLNTAVRPVQRGQHQFAISVIDVEDGTGLELSEVTLSPTFLAQFLAYFDQYALSHSLWSPDSKQIVLPIVAEGESQIVVISAESGRKQKVGSGSIAFWSRQ